MTTTTVKHGWLEKLAAKAAALTAILTLIFLVAPHLRPNAADDSDDSWERASREVSAEHSLNGTGANEAPQLQASLPHASAAPAAPSAEPGDARQADAIKQVLQGDRSAHAGALGAEQDLLALEVMAAAPPLQVLSETQLRLQRVAAAYGVQVAAMRRLPLGGTPSEFQNAYQAHISAWQGMIAALNAFEAFVGGTLLDLQARGALDPATVQQQHEGARGRVNAAEQDIAQTWDRVRSASLAAGVDPAAYEP